MVKNNTQECFLYPERSRDKKSYLSRCKCPGWVQGMRSRRTWHAGTGLSRWRLDEETKMLRQQFSLKYAVAQNSRKPRQREKRECREKGFTEQKQKSLCTCVLKLLAFSSRPLKNSNVKLSNYTMSEIRNSHNNSFTFAKRTQLCINI